MIFHSVQSQGTHKCQFYVPGFSNKQYQIQKHINQSHEKKGKRQQIRNLRITQADQYIKKAMGILLTKMPATIGIEKHGEKAMAALFKEFQQLNDGTVPGKPAI